MATLESIRARAAVLAEFIDELEKALPKIKSELDKLDEEISAIQGNGEVSVKPRRKDGSVNGEDKPKKGRRRKEVAKVENTESQQAKEVEKVNVFLSNKTGLDVTGPASTRQD